MLARHPAARVRRILQHGHRDGGWLLWRREVPRRGRRLLQVDFLPRAGHNFMMTLITTLPVVPHRSRPAKIRWLIHSESWNGAGKCATRVLLNTTHYVCNLPSYAKSLILATRAMVGPVLKRRSRRRTPN